MFRRHRKMFCAALTSLSLLIPLCASAELGGDVGSVERDRSKMKAALTVKQVARYSIHEMKTDSGSTVREFVSPEGRVFAVAWQGPFHPDYQQLLGLYFSQLQPSTQQRRARRAPVMIETPNFVFQSFGHFRALAGRAYIPQMMPSGIGVEDIQ